MQDFRQFIDLLEKSGRLKRISRTVDPKFEMPAVMQLLDEAGFSYIFENVEGSEMPVAGGLLNRHEHFGMFFGADQPRSFSHPELRALLDDAQQHPVPPRVVDTSPVKDVIKTGADASLDELPVATYFEFDSGPFITAGVGVTIDPETGVQNVGIYRTLILGDRRCLINAGDTSDLRKIYAKYKSAGIKMPIAMAIGVPPALHIAAPAKIPIDQSEIELAGALQNEPIEMIKCETSDLLVPANAEIVLEGTVDFSEDLLNNHGEFPDQYGPSFSPATDIDAITHRTDPIFHVVLAGRNREHNNLGMISVYAMNEDMTDALRQQVPDAEAVSVNFDARLGALCHVAIAIDKKDADQPRRVIEQAFAAKTAKFPMAYMAKRIVVVDTDVDVDDWKDVEWAIWTRVADESQMHMMPAVIGWELDRASDDENRSLRVGIDATMALDKRDDLVRPIIPGSDRLRLSDYLP